MKQKPILIFIGLLLLVVISGLFYWSKNGYVLISNQNDGPYMGRYWAKDSKVYFGSDGPLVEGADASSFQDYSEYGFAFGKDATHVYVNSQILEGYDPSSFKLLWRPHIVAEKYVVFVQKDAHTIGAISFDDNYAVLGSTPVKGGDPDSFTQITGGWDLAPWAKDKNNFYCHGQIMPGVDPSKTHVIDSGTKMSVVIDGTEKVLESDCRVLQQ